MSHLSIESDLDKIEQEFNIDLQRSQEDNKDEIYYPQFSYASRMEAGHMGKHYELFYCLEKSIRNLIAETLESEYGESWWTKCVPDKVMQNVSNNIKNEKDSGVTPRSESEIDYTTFGELGEIVRNKWDDFGAIFSNPKAFSKIMTSLNVLRGPIAHCCPLPQNEIVRLQLTIEDWFRLME